MPIQFIYLPITFEESCRIGHDAQRVVPECIDLHRLEDAGGDHPVVHLGVHPGELHARLAGVEQAIGGGDVDLVAGAVDVPVDDVLEDRKRSRSRASSPVASW